MDQDCSGADLLTCYVDADGVTFGGTVTIAPTDADCTDPGESPFNTDCADGQASTYPGATETPGDGIDQDCNGFDTINCIVDADKDGFGPTAGTVVQAPDGVCNTAQGEAAGGGDCDDANATVFYRERPTRLVTASTRTATAPKPSPVRSTAAVTAWEGAAPIKLKIQPKNEYTSCYILLK